MSPLPLPPCCCRKQWAGSKGGRGCPLPPFSLPSLCSPSPALSRVGRKDPGREEEQPQEVAGSGGGGAAGSIFHSRRCLSIQGMQEAGEQRARPAVWLFKGLVAKGTIPRPGRPPVKGQGSSPPFPEVLQGVRNYKPVYFSDADGVFLLPNPRDALQP